MRQRQADIVDAVAGQQGACSVSSGGASHVTVAMMDSSIVITTLIVIAI